MGNRIMGNSTKFKIAKQFRESVHPKRKAEKLVDYYIAGGTIENIVALLNDKPIAENTRLDEAENFATGLEISGIKVEDSVYDSDKKEVSVLLKESCTIDRLKKFSNDTKTKFKVKKLEDGRFALKVKIQEKFSERKDAKKILESAGKINFLSVVENHGLTAKDAFLIEKKIGIKKSIACDCCFSDMLESENTFVCRSCSNETKKGIYTERMQKFLHSLTQDDVCFCGSIFYESVCGNCGLLQEEVTTMASVAPSTASSTQEQEQEPNKTMVTGACPECAGTLLYTGDSYRCLNCQKVVSEAEFDKNQKALGEEEEIIVEPDSEEQEKDKTESNDSLVIVKPSNSPDGMLDAYSYLTSKGFLPPGTQVFIQDENSLEWVKTDTQPVDNSFMVALEDQNTARDMHSDLLANGYASEIVTKESEKNNMGDSLFGMPESKGKKRTKKEDAPEMGGFDGSTVMKFDDFDSADKYAKENDQASGRELTVVQGNDGKYWVISPEQARNFRKEIAAKEIHSDPEKEEDHLPDQYSGEYTGQPDVNDNPSLDKFSDNPEMEKQEKMGYYPGMTGGYSQPGSTFLYPGMEVPAFPQYQKESVDEFGMPRNVEESIHDSIDRAEAASNLMKVNLKLQMEGHAEITQSQLNSVLHLKSKQSNLTEISHKTGIPMEVVRLL